MKNHWLQIHADKFNCYIRKGEIVAITRDWEDENLGMFTCIQLRNGNRLFVPYDVYDIYDALVGKESEA